ncbi:hypothetical protein RND71_003997 [Anisodus tanguticus]|uniref:Ubiquitin-like domain-containing protein n=1 Tax=Anisodus tanguticus TaxID=243964 RepID=A0AAE1SXR0_9SOLA|nr:hypothetical protein RND71_003997 [Anisodus tanguticus]
MAGKPRIVRIKFESPTSEFYAEVREKSRVRELMKIITRVWGDEYMRTYHKSKEMKSDQFLSTYNIKDGSIVKVQVLAESPDQPVNVCTNNFKFMENNKKLNRFSILGLIHCVS